MNLLTELFVKRYWPFRIIALVVISGCLILWATNDKNERERAEMNLQQLTALCASINHAEFEGVFVVEDDLRSKREGKPVFILFIGREDFEAEGTMYTIYPDGRVIFSGHDAEGNSFQGKENWGDHPDFSFFKK